MFQEALNEFPFRDFRSRLILTFGDFTSYKSMLGAITNSWGLWFESEDNEWAYAGKRERHEYQWVCSVSSDGYPRKYFRLL